MARRKKQLPSAAAEEHMQSVLRSMDEEEARIKQKLKEIEKAKAAVHTLIDSLGVIYQPKQDRS